MHHTRRLRVRVFGRLVFPIYDIDELKLCRKKSLDEFLGRSLCSVSIHATGRLAASNQKQMLDEYAIQGS